ncbi:helix-turn-helix domain-containing protein [Streptomyces sp. NPDC050161]|uniref:helix-turn-helix domain-containing protein n=1 Tax=Streptomyces sp. NPDC050161 TaxID=3365604 RepID=UPI0037A2A217
MPPRKDIDGSLSVPAFYGKELRWKREAAGRTLEELVDGSFYGTSYLSEIERGQRRMPLDLARHADRVLETDGFFERRCEDVRRAKRGGHAEYFIDAIELEERAREMEEWSPTLIPGLLQTATYARAVIEAAHPMQQADQVEEKIRARLGRARLFDDPQRPEFWWVLNESLLRQPIVPREAMAEQLDHIVALARKRRIFPQVVPWTVAAHPFMMGMATIMTFDDAPPVIYTEALYSGQLIDDPRLVRLYMKAYDRLRAAAMSPEASLAMIEKAAEGYRNDEQSS